jgi:hypothetical protein
VLAAIGIAVGGQVLLRWSPLVRETHQSVGGQLLLASDQGNLAHILVLNPTIFIPHVEVPVGSCLLAESEIDWNGTLSTYEGIYDCREGLIAFAGSVICSALTRWRRVFATAEP